MSCCMSNIYCINGTYLLPEGPDGLAVLQQTASCLSAIYLSYALSDGFRRVLMFPSPLTTS